MSNVTSLTEIKTKKNIGDFQKQDIKFDLKKRGNLFQRISSNFVFSIKENSVLAFNFILILIVRFINIITKRAYACTCTRLSGTSSFM